MTSPTTVERTRLPALDGLRGVAAIVVLLYHGTQIVRPALTETGTVVYKSLADSPVKLAFAGTEAVLVFFALSGLVVALPALRAGFAWAPYYGARLIRLYLPVWAALAFAALLIVLLPRDANAAPPGSWLAGSNARAVTPAALLGEASLWRTSYPIDNVLWSLRWELLFSLLLPAFVALALLLRRATLPAIAVALGLSVLGRVLGIDALVYLPVFFAGTLIASRLEALRSWAARRDPAFWRLFGLGSAAVLVSGWLMRDLVAPGTPGGLVLWGLAGAGAAGLVVTAIGSRAAESALGIRPVQWLGRVSFSLYLVHVPVLATLAYLWGEAAWPAVLAVGIPVSLLVAELFTRLVERPSHRLAQSVRRAISRAVGLRRAVPATTAR